MTQIERIQTRIKNWIGERDFTQHHTCPEIARSLSIEAAELNELHQWGKIPNNESAKQELADILIYALDYATVCGYDVEEIIHDKMIINSRNYEISKCKGSNKKYTELRHDGI